jgi:hypothetical protein
MPIVLKPENVLDVGFDRAVDETSDERFDRGAFARRAIDLVNPKKTTVAICEGASRLRVESGPVWGRGERWAMVAIPARASRRAIALAVAGLAHDPRAYALDLLMDEAGSGKDHAEPSPASGSSASSREPTAA